VKVGNFIVSECPDQENRPSFSLVPKDSKTPRIYYFAATSPEERNSWVDTLKRGFILTALPAYMEIPQNELKLEKTLGKGLKARYRKDVLKQQITLFLS